MQLHLCTNWQVHLYFDFFSKPRGLKYKNHIFGQPGLHKFSPLCKNMNGRSSHTKTRSVWRTLQLKLLAEKWTWIGIFKPADVHSPTDAFYCLFTQVRYAPVSSDWRCLDTVCSVTRLIRHHAWSPAEKANYTITNVTYCLLRLGGGAEYFDQCGCLCVCACVRGCVCVWVGGCVCLSASISLEPLDPSSRIVLRSFPTAMARCSSDGVAIRCVLPVLWMTSCLAVMGRTWRCAERRCDTGAESGVSPGAEGSCVQKYVPVFWLLILVGDP